ncbi:MAG: hypothetical protein MMC33_002592 [Icmadophila ericetorum]|nr:hypothetical protein [Icmadophila ericetorum]
MADFPTTTPGTFPHEAEAHQPEVGDNSAATYDHEPRAGNEQSKTEIISDVYNVLKSFKKIWNGKPAAANAVTQPSQHVQAAAILGATTITPTWGAARPWIQINIDNRTLIPDTENQASTLSYSSLAQTLSPQSGGRRDGKSKHCTGSLKRRIGAFVPAPTKHDRRYGREDNYNPQ